MIRCTKCLYPETTKPFITFDEEGVCGGCRTSEEKDTIDWEERGKLLRTLIKESIKKPQNPNYDCIIPVSGGKDSTYQVHYVKNVLGLKPLLVCFNHQDNSYTGIRNLENLVTKLGCDLVRYTPSPDTVKKCCRISVDKLADPFWHEHAGIFTYPIQVAVKEKIPLIIWGEYGHLDLTGMNSLHDFVEMNKKNRVEHSMRGLDGDAFLEGNEEGLTKRDIPFAYYPSNDEISELDLVGIYLGNFIKWNSISQTKEMIFKYDFMTSEKERTFNIYENAECYYNDTVHDYMKYLKYGYNRAVDHASQLIRLGYINRDTGAFLANRYNKTYPHDKFIEWCKWAALDYKEVMRKCKMWHEVDPDITNFDDIEYDGSKVDVNILSQLYIKNATKTDQNRRYYL